MVGSKCVVELTAIFRVTQKLGHLYYSMPLIHNKRNCQMMEHILHARGACCKDLLKLLKASQGRDKVIGSARYFQKVVWVTTSQGVQTKGSVKVSRIQKDHVVQATVGHTRQDSICQ